MCCVIFGWIQTYIIEIPFIILLLRCYLKRVGIPRAAVLPPYKYRAHRRCSFNPSDGLGLPSVSNSTNVVVHRVQSIVAVFFPTALMAFVCVQHCLTGWTHRDQNTLSVPSSLDLRSSVGVEEVSRCRLSVVRKLKQHNVESQLVF